MLLLHKFIVFTNESAYCPQSIVRTSDTISTRHFNKYTNICKAYMLYSTGTWHIYK